LPKSMSLHTGGCAVGAISTKSTSASSAMRMATCTVTMPKGSLLMPTNLTSRAVISPLRRCARS
jgi:hypothetical protein